MTVAGQNLSPARSGKEGPDEAPTKGRENTGQTQVPL